MNTYRLTVVVRRVQAETEEQAIAMVEARLEDSEAGWVAYVHQVEKV